VWKQEDPGKFFLFFINAKVSKIQLNYNNIQIAHRRNNENNTAHMHIAIIYIQKNKKK